MLTKLTRDVAAALLKLANTTSDPSVAAALVTKAADIKDRLDEGAQSRCNSAKILSKHGSLSGADQLRLEPGSRSGGGRTGLRGPLQSGEDRTSNAAMKKVR